MSRTASLGRSNVSKLVGAGSKLSMHATKWASDLRVGKP
jgi:hypothetical protein